MEEKEVLHTYLSKLSKRLRIEMCKIDKFGFCVYKYHWLLYPQHIYASLGSYI